MRYTARVHDRVRRVARFGRQASHARALCASATGVLLVLALTTDESRSLDDPGALILAAIVGGLTFLTWVWTDRTTQWDVARRADERLALGGGLLAAFENAGRPARPLSELGARRTLGRAPMARLRAAAVPPFEVFLVLPLFGGVALFQAIEARDDGRPDGRAYITQVTGLAAGVKSATSAHPGELSSAQMDELEAAAMGALEAARGGDEQEMEEAMRRVAEALDDAAAALPEGAPLAEKLEHLAFEAEAATADSDPAAPAQGEPSQGAEAGPADVEPENEPGEDPANSAAGSVAEAESGPGSDPGADSDHGANSGPSSGEGGGVQPVLGGAEAGESSATGDSPESSEQGPPGTPGQAQEGPPESLGASSAAPAPWWPAEHDALVRAWLDGPR